MAVSLPSEDDGLPARSRADRARATERRWLRATGLRLLVADPDRTRQADTAGRWHRSGCSWRMPTTS